MMISLLVLGSCGGSPEADAPDATVGPPEFPAPAAGEGVQLVLTAEVAPGQELYQCRYIALPEEVVQVVRFAHYQTAGAHHMLIYPTALRPQDIPADGQAVDCTALGDRRATGVAYGGTEPEGEFAYPPGVGMEFAAGSVVLVEGHYLNATDSPQSAEVRANLWFAEEPVAQRAGTLFFSNWAIYVPPAPGIAAAQMSCEIPGDVSMLFSTSHMHRRGTRFESSLTPGPADEATVLHETDNWAAPVPDVYWPPLEVTAGSRVEFGCSFRNDRSQPTVEGESADTNEMCVFVASYWPRFDNLDAELCLLDGSGPVLAGQDSCAEVVDCMLDAGVGDEVGGQRCIQDGCPGSAAALSRFLVCVERYDCWGDQSCVAFNCLDAWNECSTAGC